MALEIFSLPITKIFLLILAQLFLLSLIPISLTLVPLFFSLFYCIKATTNLRISKNILHIFVWILMVIVLFLGFYLASLCVDFLIDYPLINIALR